MRPGALIQLTSRNELRDGSHYVILWDDPDFWRRVVGQVIDSDVGVLLFHKNSGVGLVLFGEQLGWQHIGNFEEVP